MSVPDSLIIPSPASFPPENMCSSKSVSLFLFCMSSYEGLKGRSACNPGDLGLILGLARSPGEGNGNPLHYSCLENPMDRGAWRAAVRGVTKSQTRLRDFTVKVCKTIF